MWDYAKFRNHIALYDENNVSISYEQLQKEEQKMIDIVKERCLIFVLCRNETGAVIGYSAFVNGNMVPVLLNAHLEKELLDNLLVKYKPSYLWIPQELFIEFPEMEIVYSAWNYALVRTGFHIQYKLNPNLCMLLTTSGSTGSPQFVRQSYDNVKKNAESIVEYLKLDASERPITTLPMNYTYGLSIINSHLMVGATILVTSKSLMQKEFWNFFKEQRATSFGGVPYTYEILDRLHIFKMDLPSLHCMTQAGGKITLELHKKFAKYAVENGKKFVVMYGQCEATARMGYLPAEKTVEKCGSIGIAIPGGKFYLVDENGHKITEPNVTGELVYEGANVTLGYAECGEDLSKGDEKHGVLLTGDMAKFDLDGYYYIVGRKKRFLKIYGNRVNLDEIEGLVKGKFENIDFACGGTDDHMYLFLTDGKLAESVKTFLTGTTKLNPAAFKAIVLEEIPQNESGKVLYKELTKYYERF